MALQRFGRIGRDPDRMPEVIERVGRAWKRRPWLRFGELLCSVAPAEVEHRPNLFALEDDRFLEMLAEAEERLPTTNDEKRTEREPSTIDAFLSRVADLWSKEPDTRFGTATLTFS
jgi:hypothetical protein